MFTRAFIFTTGGGSRLNLGHGWSNGAGDDSRSFRFIFTWSILPLLNLRSCHDESLGDIMMNWRDIWPFIDSETTEGFNRLCDHGIDLSEFAFLLVDLISSVLGVNRWQFSCAVAIY